MAKLEEVFEKYTITSYEHVTEEFMLPYLMEKLHYKIMLYGAGKIGRIAIKYLRDIYRIEPDVIVDAAPVVEGIEGIEVISLEKFMNMQEKKKEKYVAVMSTSFFSNNRDEANEIVSKLAVSGVEKTIDVLPSISSIIKPEWYQYILENKDKLIDIYNNMFSDEVSRETYFQYILALLEGHAYGGREYAQKDKYFGIEDGGSLYEHREDECWINLGSCRGDTIYYFINGGFSFEKIYAIEGEQNIIGALKRNLDYLEKETRNKIAVINSYFGKGENQAKLDDVFADKKITLINMDIEGAELDVIKSARKVIQKNRPVLSICVYHKPDDIVSILSYLQETVEDYTFYLRKYVSSSGDYYNGRYRLNELVLYAIPKERANTRSLCNK